MTDCRFYTNVSLIRGRIHLRGYDDQGKQVQKRVDYSPTLYLPTKDEQSYHTLDGTNVQPVEFRTISEANRYLRESEGVSNKVVYGYEQFVYTYIADQFPGTIDYDPSLIRIANIDIETASDEGMPDIEIANKEITAITVMYGDDVLSLGLGDFTTNDKDVTYVKCESEVDMLLKFLDSWEWYAPDVVTGWFIEGFDIPYIVNRLRNVLGPESANRLSPWRDLREKNVFNHGKMRKLYFPTGIALLDYIKIYRKMELEPRESYSLNYIASVEVGAKKLDYSEYESLNSLYKLNFQKFMEYNIQDVRLVDQIEKKKKMLNLTFQMAYTAHCNFEDINSPVRMWEAIVYNDLIGRNIVFPPRQNVAAPAWTDDADGEDEVLEGGYVKEPIPGRYDWVVSIDLVSSYPHQIMQTNVSPETLLNRVGIERRIKQLRESLEREEELLDLQRLLDLSNTTSVETFLSGEIETTIAKEYQLIVAPNGCFYDRRREGFLPRLLNQWFSERDNFKKVMKETKKILESSDDHTPASKHALENKLANYNNKQKVYKVALNSAYGALSNKWFRFYNYDLADTVTACGRLAVRWAEKKLNEYINRLMFTNDVDYVIAMDTDSVYLNLASLVEKKYGKGPFSKEERLHIVDRLDEIARNKLEPYIAECYLELQKKVNAPKNRMKMARDVIADIGIWTGKKRYVLNVWDKEGVRFHDPQIEIKGMDSVRSSTPTACRQAIKDLVKIILYKDEKAAQDFIAKFKKEFETLPFDEIAFPRGINGLEKYSEDDEIKKGTPPQVRGAIVYNAMLKEKNITNFQPIYDGDKAKFCYLTLPNAARSHVITVPNALPKALNLDDKLDRDSQFEVGFLSPVRKIMDAIGWRVEPEGNTLDDFMSGKLG